MNLKVTTAEEALKGQDKILVNQELGIFGVFDGLGGMPAGDVAAETAVAAVEQSYGENPDPAEPQAAKQALESAEKAIEQKQASPRGMSTTATIAHIYEQGRQLRAAYAHVGDTRLYHWHGQGQALTIRTEDEGRGSMLIQALGLLESVEQFGAFEIEKGDRLMLCSDGITGDYEDELLSDEEISESLQMDSLQNAADDLLAKSRKRDDKALILIEIT